MSPWRTCFRVHRRRGRSWEARSRASGSVHLDLPPGEYKVVLQKPGFGRSFSSVSIPPSREAAPLPAAADGLLGYAWPKWVRAARIRVPRSRVEPYKLELWRYGGSPSSSAASAGTTSTARGRVMQVTPGRRLHPHRREVELGRLRQPDAPAVRGPARTEAGCTTFARPLHRGKEVRVPVGRRARDAAPRRSRCWRRTSPGTPTTISAAGATTSTPTRFPPTPTSTPVRTAAVHRAEHGTWGYPAYAPLSFDRPEPFNHIAFEERITDPIEGRQACHLAPAEWRLLGWLERERFAYDYYAETQLDDGTLDLSKYRVLVSACTPSTGPGGCTTASSSWVFNDGRTAVYLGGNGLNCEVELTPMARWLPQRFNHESLARRA
jgi:N,N-dimethylformamidase